MQVVAQEAQEVAKKFGTPRRTQVQLFCACRLPVKWEVQGSLVRRLRTGLSDSRQGFSWSGCRGGQMIMAVACFSSRGTGGLAPPGL